MTDVQETTEIDPTMVWHKTACVLCSNNCGVEVRLDDRSITRVRGNKAHLASKGYTCEKALRIDHYQNAKSRLSLPMKRLEDGTYIEVDWDTAIEEVAEGFQKVVQKHGGDKIFYYGGGGQGNHLCGGYGAATRQVLGVTQHSNALAQEKTGESWVEGHLFGAHTHGEFHDAKVSIFLGKNPWHSHGFDETRRVLKEIASDDSRTMIVIDPRKTETADLADIWLPVKPAGDAFLLAAIGAVIVEEGLVATTWVEENVLGVEDTITALSSVPIAEFAERSGIGEEKIREIARLLAKAESISVYEDLGIEMAPHSTLISYLQRIIWVLLGSFGKSGAMAAHSWMIPMFNYSSAGSEPVDPVTGGRIIGGLTPCNEIADGFLSENPQRCRAMLIESVNPVHSLAESSKFRAAMRAAEFSVVIDVAMTETALQADYVLPAASQYEKAEATFFSFAFPENRFCVRPAILSPFGESLPEAEIHSRLVRALGGFDDFDLEPLRKAAEEGIDAFTESFMAASMEFPSIFAIGSIVLYETLGQFLPDEVKEAAVLWMAAQRAAMTYPKQVKAAGHIGDGPSLGTSLFKALISSPDGVVFTRHEHEEAWELVQTPDGLIHLSIPELLEEIYNLGNAPVSYTNEQFPFVLVAGERRSFTANTIMRDPSWRKRDPEGTLRINPNDAKEKMIVDGDRVRITTPGGTAVAVAEVNETMMQGCISLPNGFGLSYSPAGGDPEITGVAPNELTTTDWCDPIAGTPWHKHVPANLEPVKN